MTPDDLQLLLARFPNIEILVVGDFFLDRYLVIDSDLAETSLETGLEAHQVVEIRNSPGAAGTVTANLAALGVGNVRILGVIGTDSHGHDLKKALCAIGVDTEYLFETPDLFTPTYTKPIDRKTGAEMARLDVKNRTPMPVDLENRMLQALRVLIPQVHGVIVLDQVSEHNCGVLTDRVIAELSHLAKAHSNTIILADSRIRIGAFQNITLKPNAYEAVRTIYPDYVGEPDSDLLKACIQTFSKRTDCPVFVTQGPEGILCTDGNVLTHIPAIPISGPIDTVGAGDAVSAAVVSALCAGATYQEAALLGMIASSITIEQIGTTGTASPNQILQRFRETYPAGWQDTCRDI